MMRTRIGTTLAVGVMILLGCESPPPATEAPPASAPRPAGAAAPVTKAPPAVAPASAEAERGTLSRAETVYVDLLCLGRLGGEKDGVEARGRTIFKRHGIAPEDYQRAMVKLRADPDFAARIGARVERTCPAPAR